MPKKTTRPQGPPRPCFICDGTGEKCQCCGESAAVCEGYCDDENGGLMECPDCKGTGIASADLKKEGK